MTALGTTSDGRKVASEWREHAEFRAWMVAHTDMAAAEIDEGFADLVRRGYLEQLETPGQPTLFRMTFPNRPNRASRQRRSTR